MEAKHKWNPNAIIFAIPVVTTGLFYFFSEVGKKDLKKRKRKRENFLLQDKLYHFFFFAKAREKYLESISGQEQTKASEKETNSPPFCV